MPLDDQTTSRVPPGRPPLDPDFRLRAEALFATVLRSNLSRALAVLKASQPDDGAPSDLQNLIERVQATIDSTLKAVQNIENPAIREEIHLAIRELKSAMQE